MFLVTPQGGLCNRLFVLDAALRLSAAIQQRLSVNWHIDRDLGCPFDRLLERPAGIAALRPVPILDRSPRARFRKHLARALTWRPGQRKYGQEDIETLSARGFDFTTLRAHRHLAISTWIGFHSDPTDFHTFRPVAALKPRIAEATRQFDTTIGVHIRRSDHRPAREFSPTRLFVDEMRAALAANPATNFFLATDDPLEESGLNEAFPGKIIVHPKRSRDRSDPRAIEDAVVDLFCLAATMRIIGSCASTFSTCAGRLRGVPVTTVQSEPNPAIAF